MLDRILDEFVGTLGVLLVYWIINGNVRILWRKWYNRPTNPLPLGSKRLRMWYWWQYSGWPKWLVEWTKNDFSRRYRIHNPGPKFRL